jgi:hypothetical protein
MPIAVETIMDMLEKAIRNPTDRWRALREMVKLNKNKPNSQKPATRKKKRGRPANSEKKQ